MPLLTDKEILKIYKEHNWFIFEPDLYRCQTIAQAQHQKDVEWLEKRIEEGYDHQRGGVRTLIIELDPLDWQAFKGA